MTINRVSGKFRRVSYIDVHHPHGGAHLGYFVPDMDADDMDADDIDVLDNISCIVYNDDTVFTAESRPDMHNLKQIALASWYNHDTKTQAIMIDGLPYLP